MKTILILTDFSSRAANAADFAMNIAVKNKADLILCHAMELASELADGVELNWPIADHLADKKETTSIKLNQLGEDLKKSALKKDKSFIPNFTYITDFGLLADVAEKIIGEQSVDLVVMGSHKSNDLERFLFGSHSHTALDKLGCPILFVPEKLTFKGISSIAYATDLSFNNSKVIKYLVRMAKAFNASVSVNHISPLDLPLTADEQTIKSSLKAYLNSFEPPVFYHNIKGYNIKTSLLEITGSGKADVLALVHKRYDFFHRLFHASVSKQMADSAEIPLLVLPYSFSVNEDSAAKSDPFYHAGDIAG